MKKCHLLLLVLLVVGLVVGCCDLTEGQEAGIQEELLEPVAVPDWKAKKITLFHTFAGGTPTSPDRISFGWGVGLSSGYQRFFMEEEDNDFVSMKEHYKNGVRSFWVHCVQGRLPGFPMRFDMNPIIDVFAESGKLPPDQKISGKFLSYWCARFLLDCPDAEITWYIGALDVSPDLVVLRDDPQAYMQRVMRSLQPFTDLYDVHGINRARTHLYIDHAGGGETDFKTYWIPDTPRGSTEHAVLQLIRSWGYQVGIEPHHFAKPNFEHLYEFNVCTNATHWYRASLKRDVKPLLEGHVAVLCMSPNEAEQYAKDLIRDRFIDEIVVTVYSYKAVVKMQEEYIASLPVDE